MPRSHVDPSAAPLQGGARGTISVMFPSYNHACYIGQTLESALVQTRPPDEIIVIDDGSTDNTSTVVQPYLDRIMFVEQENQGVARALDRGLALCQGDYVLLLASDDWLAPDALEKLGEVLDRERDVGVAYGDTTVVDEQGQPLDGWKQVPRPLGKHRDTGQLILRNFIPTAPLCRRAALLQSSPYFDSLFCQDWAMWLKIAMHGWSYYGLATPVAYYRRHAGNLSDPKYRFRASDDTCAMLDAIREQFGRNMTRAEKQACLASKRNIVRSLAWTSFWQRDYATARRMFADLTIRHRALPDLFGLASTFVPFSVVLRAREIVRQHQQSAFGIRVKHTILSKLIFEAPYF